MEKKIEQIMENFDFEKVHRAMAAWGWQWYLGERGSGIPSVVDLRCTALELLAAAWDEKTQLRTGGFTAEYIDGGLSLMFVIEQCAV